jgi:hypothetical protein
MIDPTRIIAVRIRINHEMFVEGKQKRMSGFDIVRIHAVNLLVGKQLALILNQASAFFDGGDGEYAIAVNRRLPSSK